MFHSSWLVGLANTRRLNIMSGDDVTNVMIFEWGRASENVLSARGFLLHHLISSLLIFRLEMQHLRNTLRASVPCFIHFIRTYPNYVIHSTRIIWLNTVFITRSSLSLNFIQLSWIIKISSLSKNIYLPFLKYINIKKNIFTPQCCILNTLFTIS